MRLSHNILPVLALGLGLLGCGGASHDTHSNDPSGAVSGDIATTNSKSAVNSSGGYLKNDGDTDFDDEPSYHGVPKSDDLSLLRSSGPKAGPAESQTVGGLVKSYYAASAAEDGARACAFLYSSLAGGLEAGQGGPSGSADKGCTGPMSVLLKQQHQHLLAENVATMTILGVYLKGNTGLVVLGFKNSPESDMLVEREGRTWKIDALFDSEMP